MPQQTPRNKTPGRGAAENIANRYEALRVEFDDLDPAITYEEFDGQKPALRTLFFKDQTKSILASNDSPDIPFTYSVNAYRGCEHGCAYCYARPTHEYLGLSAGLDFESRIFVKTRAPELLRQELSKKSWKSEAITFSGVTDCYQPVERQLQLTRRCLEVLREFKNPVAMITKNALVARDIDILSEMASWNGAVVFLSITSLDPELCGSLEPRTSRPHARLETLKKLSEAGIPVGVNVAPVIPGLNDHEIPSILKAASEAGAKFAGYTMVRLPLTVAPVFLKWLEVNQPLRKDKVMHHIQDIRGGKINDSSFVDRMRGQGVLAANVRQLFKLHEKKFGFNQTEIQLSTDQFRLPSAQLSLWT